MVPEINKKVKYYYTCNGPFLSSEQTIAAVIVENMKLSRIITAIGGFVAMPFFSGSFKKSGVSQDISSYRTTRNVNSKYNAFEVDVQAVFKNLVSIESTFS